MVFTRTALPVLGLLVGGALHAQQQVGPAFERLPPFADTVLHRTVDEVLLAMDVFDGERSMDLLGKALLVAGDPPDPEVLYYLLSYRAEVLYYEGLFHQAVRDLDRCEELALELGDSTLMANMYNLKGLLHENIQDSRLALPYLRSALAWFPARPAARYPVSELHHIHGNLGSHLIHLGQLDSAATHLRRSLQLASEAGAQRAIAVAHWGLGNLALRRQRPDSALWQYEQAVTVAHAARDHDIGVDAMAGRANALVAIGRRTQARGALDSAAAYLDAYRAGIGLVTQRNFARVAAKAGQAMDELPTAIRWLGEWHRIDSLITAHNIRSALATQAELLETDRDLERERLEKRLMAERLAAERRTRLVLSSATAVVVLAIVLLYRVNLSRVRQQQRVAELDVQRLEQQREIDELRIRDQLGRDMHDDLGAGLSALKLRSEMAARGEPDPGERVRHLDTAREAGELLTNMRHLIWALAPGRGGTDDLAAYITGYARRTLGEHGLAVEVSDTGPWPGIALDAHQRRNLFLVVKEALNNTLKHAGASRVDIALRWNEGINLRIADDGTGPGTEVPGPAQQGNGLRNMNARAAEMGGTLTVGHGAPDLGWTSGTTITLHVPAAALNKSYVDRTPRRTDLRSR